jgi:hypothetical protein
VALRHHLLIPDTPSTVSTVRAAPQRSASATATANACWSAGPGADPSERLRIRAAKAIAAGTRAVSEVAVGYDVSWPTPHKVLVAAAAQWLQSRHPRRLRTDVTRFCSVRVSVPA